MSGLLDDCKLCGLPMESSVHTPADECQDCRARHEHHAFEPTPLRLAVQELYEDWLRHEDSRHLEGYEYYARRSDLLRAAKQRAETLGLEWRHEAELAEQLYLEDC